jgi:hypothetical protein
MFLVKLILIIPKYYWATTFLTAFTRVWTWVLTLRQINLPYLGIQFFFKFGFNLIWRLDSTIVIAARQRDEQLKNWNFIPYRGSFSSLQRPDRLRSSPSFYPVYTRGFSPGVKQLGSDLITYFQLLQKLKNAQIYNLAAPDLLMLWYLIKHRENILVCYAPIYAFVSRWLLPYIYALLMQPCVPYMQPIL